MNDSTVFVMKKARFSPLKFPGKKQSTQVRYQNLIDYLLKTL